MHIHTEDIQSVEATPPPLVVRDANIEKSPPVDDRRTSMQMISIDDAQTVKYMR